MYGYGSKPKKKTPVARKKPLVTKKPDDKIKNYKNKKRK
jgi:hypothetical protein